MRITTLDELAHILDWQQRGAAARVLGLPQTANPLLLQKPDQDCPTRAEWKAHVDAWMFGWMVEDCFREDTVSIAA